MTYQGSSGYVGRVLNLKCRSWTFGPSHRQFVLSVDQWLSILNAIPHCATILQVSVEAREQKESTLMHPIEARVKAES